jgi:tetratricopeptide (TPR) repeat protein
MALSKFESMLKTNKVYFFDSSEFEEIIHHYLDNGRISLAKKAVKLSLEQHPTSVLLKLLKAELYIFEQEFLKAESLLNELESIEPTNDEIHIQRASIFSKNHEHKKAIDSLSYALQHTNDEGDVCSLLAMEYLYLDDFKNARSNFAKCIDFDIEDYSSLYNIIYCFDMDEMHSDAVSYLKVYIDKNPYSEIAWHQLGRQYTVLKEFENALRAFDYAVLIDDSFIGGYLEKAKTLEVLDRNQEAIENYLITLELDDATAFVYLRIGDCFKKLDNIQSAANYYKKAVNEDPLLEKGWLALTDVYFESETYSKSLYYIKKVISIDEYNAVYWRKLGEINLKLSLFEEAVVAFKQCLSLGDKSIEVSLALIDVHYYIGDYREAYKSLQVAASYFDNNAVIAYRFFGVCMQLKNSNEAITHLKNALVLDYDFHKVAIQLYPEFFALEKVQSILETYKPSA